MELKPTARLLEKKIVDLRSRVGQMAKKWTRSVFRSGSLQDYGWDSFVGRIGWDKSRYIGCTWIYRGKYVDCIIVFRSFSLSLRCDWRPSRKSRWTRRLRVNSSSRKLRRIDMPGFTIREGKDSDRWEAEKSGCSYRAVTELVKYGPCGLVSYADIKLTGAQSWEIRDFGPSRWLPGGGCRSCLSSAGIAFDAACHIMSSPFRT